MENRKEKLYLANSTDLVQLIIELELTEFWPSLKFDKQVMKSISRTSQIGGFGTASNRIGGNAQRKLIEEDIEKNQQLDKMLQV